MCDEIIEDDDLEFDDYEYVDDAPGPVKYYPAEPPTPLVSRLMFYKAAKSYKNFMPNLVNMFTPIERNGKRKPRLLALRLHESYFLFKAVDYNLQRGMVDVSFYGKTMHFPTIVPATLTMRLAYVGKELWLKYGELDKALKHGNRHSVTIAGQTFWAAHCGYERTLTDEEVKVEFRMHVDANALRHEDERNQQRAPKADFKKYVAKERQV